MSAQRRIEAHLEELAALIARVSPADVREISDEIVRASDHGHRVFVIGNGGSAATASHFVTDLTKTAAVRDRFVRAVSLTDNSALLTATANDLGYERIFEEQLKREANMGDLLVAISGSGNSPNVLRAAQYARAHGMTVVALCGFAGGRLAQLCHTSVIVEATNIQLVEDVHSAVAHAIATGIRDHFETENASTGPARAAVFIDRDGVINVRRPHDVRQWSDFEFLPGSIAALARLHAAGLPVVVVTNQPIIERDGVASTVVDDIHERMRDAVQSAGGRIEMVLTCPHAPSDSCSCRKPRPGLFYRAASALQLDLQQSIVIGDSWRDAWAARSLGCRAVQIAAIREAGDAPAKGERHLRAHDLESAVALLLEGDHPTSGQRVVAGSQ